MPPRRPGPMTGIVGWLRTGIVYLCHPERPQGVEGSLHESCAVQTVSAKILRRASLAQDDSVIMAGPSVHAGQSSGMVGGVVLRAANQKSIDCRGQSHLDSCAPTLQRAKKKTPLSLKIRDKGANPLRYHSCSGNTPGARFAVSGEPGAAYFYFGALLGGDTPYRAHYCLAPNGSSLECGMRRDLSSS